MRVLIILVSNYLYSHHKTSNRNNTDGNGTDDETNNDDDDRLESSDYFDVEENQEEFKNHHSDNSASDDDLSLAEIRLKSAEKRKRLKSAVCKSKEGKNPKIIGMENFELKSKQPIKRSERKSKHMTENDCEKGFRKNIKQEKLEQETM